ncbi:transglycosylase domain-containing protein [Malaciobacter marinus]
MQNKLNKCTQMVDIKSNEISDMFVEYLISAEDHRSKYHFGIDHIGIARAFFIWLNNNKVQGASTIEQQFVRVVSSDYTNSLFRKFKEQILAVALTKKRNKANIAKAYLAIAYYGYKCEGTKGIKKYIGTELKYISEIQIISIVARLKYPKPLKDSLKWHKKHTNRINYIKFRHKKIANKT